MPARGSRTRRAVALLATATLAGGAALTTASLAHAAPTGCAATFNLFPPAPGKPTRAPTQPTPGPTESVVVGFGLSAAGRLGLPVTVAAGAGCVLMRTHMVESTLTSQTIPPEASGDDGHAVS